MADLPFWFNNNFNDAFAYFAIIEPGEWDSLVIGGKRMPGLATVDVDQEAKADQKKAAGKSGSTVTYHGRDPARISIRIVVWTPEQLDELQQRLAELWPPGVDKKAPGNWDAYHPNLALLGIKSIFLKSISGFKDGPVAKAKMITITAVELRKGTKTVTKTQKSSYGNNLAPKRLNATAAYLSPVEAGGVGAGTVLAAPKEPDNATQDPPSTDHTVTDPR